MVGIFAIKVLDGENSEFSYKQCHSISLRYPLVEYESAKILSRRAPLSDARCNAQK